MTVTSLVGHTIHACVSSPSDFNKCKRNTWMPTLYHLWTMQIQSCMGCWHVVINHDGNITTVPYLFHSVYTQPLPPHHPTVAHLTPSSNPVPTPYPSITRPPPHPIPLQSSTYPTIILHHPPAQYPALMPQSQPSRYPPLIPGSITKNPLSSPVPSPHPSITWHHLPAQYPALTPPLPDITLQPSTQPLPLHHLTPSSSLVPNPYPSIIWHHPPAQYPALTPPSPDTTFQPSTQPLSVNHLTSPSSAVPSPYPSITWHHLPAQYPTLTPHPHPASLDIIIQPITQALPLQSHTLSIPPFSPHPSTISPVPNPPYQCVSPPLHGCEAEAGLLVLVGPDGNCSHN